MKVSVIMGSKSDFDVVKPALKILDRFGVERDVRVISAHRTPEEAHRYVKEAEKNGTDVFIGVAGKAAHLAGVIASFTARPVIALPVATSMMGGLDSLLSMVQMPSGVPVATVAVNGGENAGLLAVQILSVKDDGLKKKLADFKKELAEKTQKADRELQAELLDL